MFKLKKEITLTPCHWKKTPDETNKENYFEKSEKTAIIIHNMKKNY